MSNFYQIKYAVMPVDKFGQLDGNYETVFNVVSKCYVVSENHLKDSSNMTMYEVVFPFQNFDDMEQDFLRKSEPTYDLHNNCNNSVLVSCVFDSFDDALVVAKLANSKLLLDEIGILPFDDDFNASVEVLQEAHKGRLERYKGIERKIEDLTVGMVVSKSHRFDLDSVIDRVTGSSSDFYTRIAESLSIDERNYLKSLVGSRSCNNCLNGLCNVDKTEKNVNDDCSLWTNKELIGKQLLLSSRH